MYKGIFKVLRPNVKVDVYDVDGPLGNIDGEYYLQDDMYRVEPSHSIHGKEPRYVLYYDYRNSGVGSRITYNAELNQVVSRESLRKAFANGDIKTLPDVSYCFDYPM